MRNARSGTHNHRRTEFFRDRESFRDKILAFLGIAWFQHRDMAQNRERPGVFLALRRTVAIRVIRDNDHHGRLGTGIGQRQQRFQSHVQTEVLHRHQGFQSRKVRADGRFHRGFFVGGKFKVKLWIVPQFFLQCIEIIADFRCRRTRISGNELHSALQSTADDRFVAQKHHLFAF